MALFVCFFYKIMYNKTEGDYMKKLLIVLGLLLTLSACEFNNSSEEEQTPTEEKSNTDVTMPDIPLN